MKGQITPPTDDEKIRCPRLGHQISFSYCRSENLGLPCFKTLDCWYEHFAVAEYMKQELTTQEYKKVFGGPPKPKILSLVELIEQAKRQAEEK